MDPSQVPLSVTRQALSSSTWPCRTSAHEKFRLATFDHVEDFFDLRLRCGLWSHIVIRQELLHSGHEHGVTELLERRLILPDISYMHAVGSFRRNMNDQTVRSIFVRTQFCADPFDLCSWHRQIHLHHGRHGGLLWLVSASPVSSGMS